MHYVIVEPHVDDAFLSLGWHLEKLLEGHEKTIITVYSDPKRDKEAEEYAKSVGATSISLGLQESAMDSKGPIKIIPELKELLKDYLVDSTQIIGPLGLQHPDHIKVAITCRGFGCQRYLDTPYLTKLKLASSLQEKCDGCEIVSIAFPSKTKWRKKTIFKSQAKFFHFNPLEDFAPPELIIR